MTPAELHRALEILGWSARQLALRTGRPGQRGHDWMSERFRVPPDVADWLKKMARHIEKNPPPQRQAKEPNE